MNEIKIIGRDIVYAGEVVARLNKENLASTEDRFLTDIQAVETPGSNNCQDCRWYDPDVDG